MQPNDQKTQLIFVFIYKYLKEYFDFVQNFVYRFSE